MHAAYAMPAADTPHAAAAMLFTIRYMRLQDARHAAIAALPIRRFSIQVAAVAHADTLTRAAYAILLMPRTRDSALDAIDAILRLTLMTRMPCSYALPLFTFRRLPAAGRYGVAASAYCICAMICQRAMRCCSAAAPCH